MHLDQQSVRACRNRRKCHWRDKITNADPMRRIRHHRQVRQFLQYRNRRDVHGISRIRLVGSNTAFAEHQVVVSAGENVLCGQQHLLNRCCDAPLQQYRRACVAKLAQQIESSAYCARLPESSR